jgi:hypothetical protein
VQTLSAQRVTATSRYRKTLPPRLNGILHFEALEAATGVDASSLRRTVATFVEFAATEGLPNQPIETFRFLGELQLYLLECHGLAHAVRGYEREIARLTK